MMRFPMMLILAWPLMGAATAPVAERGRFGDFTYDASAYSVEGDEIYIVRSRRDRDQLVMMATIKDAPASECSIAKLDSGTMAERRDHTFRTLKRDGFEIHMVSWYQGCRNARPPSVAACTAYRGRVYRFHASTIGCKGGPGFGSRPDGFLGSLAAVP